jgi:hypothetical protein
MQCRIDRRGEVEQRSSGAAAVPENEWNMLVFGRVEEDVIGDAGRQ